MPKAPVGFHKRVVYAIADKNMIDYMDILAEIRELYLEDSTPWVIGYSGGKDSTTVLQMVFHALSNTPRQQLSKQIHVLCNDTLVENPAIKKYVDRQLANVEQAGKSELYAHNPDLFNVARLIPRIEDRYWVNLIGRGYPSPNRWFRWCTERLKIRPTSQYIQTTLARHSRVIIVLGTRKAESANRALSMSNHDRGELLRSHTLPGVFVYTPIADLTNHEVWAYLLQAANPWGGNNRELLAVYRNACTAGECPFVIETGTQSCGKSRFGCWVCTVVARDRAMECFVNNGEDWMEGLLQFRNWLYDIRQESYQQVPSRINGRVKYGPFLLSTRREILEKLLALQERLSIELIENAELQAVRRMLKEESEAAGDGLEEYVLQLANGHTLKVLSDHNILATSRQRLAAFSLAGAKVVEKAQRLDCTRLTRIVYHQE